MVPPSRTLLNPGRKRGYSPDPSPSSRPAVETPASGSSGMGSVPGFSVEQLASLHLIIRSCLSSAAAPPAVAPTTVAHSPVPPPATVSPRAPLPQPARVYNDPRPGPSWEYNSPTVDDSSDVPPDEAGYDRDYSPELVVLSDAEDSDDINPPVGRSRRDTLTPRRSSTACGVRYRRLFLRSPFPASKVILSLPPITAIIRFFIGGTMLSRSSC